MDTDEGNFVVFLLPSPRRVWEDVATISSSPITAGKRPLSRRQDDDAPPTGAWTWHQTFVSSHSSSASHHRCISKVPSHGNNNSKRRRFDNPSQPEPPRPIRPPYYQVANVSDGSIQSGFSQSALPAARTAARPLSSARMLDFALGAGGQQAQKGGHDPDLLGPKSSEFPCKDTTIPRNADAAAAAAELHKAGDGILQFLSHNTHSPPVVPDTSSSCGLSVLAAESSTPPSPAQDVTSYSFDDPAADQHPNPNWSSIGSSAAVAEPTGSDPALLPLLARGGGGLPESNGLDSVGSSHSTLHLPSQPFRFRLNPSLLSITQVVSRATNLLPVRYRNGAPPALGGMAAEAPGAPAPRFDLLGIVQHVGPIQPVPLPPWKAATGFMVGAAHRPDHQATTTTTTQDVAEIVLVNPSGMMLTIELHGSLAQWAGETEAGEKDATSSVAGLLYDDHSRTHHDQDLSKVRSTPRSTHSTGAGNQSDNVHTSSTTTSDSNSKSSSKSNSDWNWNNTTKTNNDRTNVAQPRSEEVARNSVGGSVPSAGEFTLGLLDTAPGPAALVPGARAQTGNPHWGLAFNRPSPIPRKKEDSKSRPRQLQPGDVVHLSHLVLRAVHPHKQGNRWVWDGIAAVAQPADVVSAAPVARTTSTRRRNPRSGWSSAIEVCYRKGDGRFDPALADLDGRYARVLTLIQAAERLDIGG